MTGLSSPWNQSLTIVPPLSLNYHSRQGSRWPLSPSTCNFTTAPFLWVYFPFLGSLYTETPSPLLCGLLDWSIPTLFFDGHLSLFATHCWLNIKIGFPTICLASPGFTGPSQEYQGIIQRHPVHVHSRLWALAVRTGSSLANLQTWLPSNYSSTSSLTLL